MARTVAKAAAENAAQEPQAEKQAQTSQPAQQTGIILDAPSPRELIPVGNHFARCYRMLLLGTIEEEFEGNKVKNKKIMLSWELPTELRVFKKGDEEKPMTIHKEFTASIGKRANLRKMIDSWRGKALTEEEAKFFDITKLLGKACLLNVIHKVGKKDPSKITEDIASVAPLVKGMPTYEAVNEVTYFNFTDKFDQALVEKLPDFVKNKIKSSDEWKEKMGQAQPGITVTDTHTPPPVDDEDLPF
jgi:hypothetical protein